MSRALDSVLHSGAKTFTAEDLAMALYSELPGSLSTSNSGLLLTSHG